MKKEQIAFIVILGLLAAFYLFGGGDDSSGARTRRSGKSASPPEPLAAEAMSGYWPGTEEGGGAWSVVARNMFRAPRDTEPLKPPQLLPPPLPRLPHPGIPMTIPLGTELLAKLRHEIVPDPNLSLPAPGSRAAAPTEPDPSAAAEGANGTGGDGASAAELAEVDRSAVGMSESDKLRLSVEERLRKEKQDAEAKKAESERRRGLDTLVWVGGETNYGTMAELDKKSNRYVIKSEIDRLRSDPSLTEDDRRQKLEALKFVFRDDRGANKPPGRTVVNALNIQRIEFAPAIPLHRYHLAKLRTPADDLERQEDLAKMVFETGEMDVAAAHLEEMIARGLTSPKTYGMLADAYRRTWHYDKELATIEKGLAAYPEDVGLLARQGQLALRLEVPARAEFAFTQVLQKDPAHALAHLGLGQILLERGEAEAAIAHLRQAETGIGLDKEQQIRALVMLGEAWLLRNQASTASNYFNQVLDRDPKHARALGGNAIVAFVTSGPAAAKALVDRGREANPLDGSLAYLDAVCMLRLDKFVDARNTLLLAEELDPLLTSRIRTAMSWLMEKAGKDEAALAEADQALVANPLDLSAHLQRARALLNVGDFDEARKEYLKALEGWPDRVDILVALGDAAFRTANYVDAARFYERAEARDRNFPDLLARRLFCEVRRGREAGAEELMKRVDATLEADPVIQIAQSLYYFLRGKYEEMLRKLRLVVEKKAAPPDLVEYSASVLGLVEDTLAKERWFDDFNRTGGQLHRDWKRYIGNGVNIAVVDSQARLEGTQKERSDAATVLAQERPGKQFYSFAVDLFAEPQPGSWMGMGLMAFNSSQREPDPWPGLQRREGNQVSHVGLQVAVSPQGKLQWRKIVQQKPTEWADVPDVNYANGTRVAIELADAQKSVYRVLVNGQTVLDGIDVPGLSRRAGQVELQVFVQAQIDRQVRFAADNAEIVTYKK